MAGYRWDDIAQAIGYASHAGAIAAVESALKRTLTPPAQQWRALTVERLTKILSVYWPKLISGDEGAAKICLRTIADLRAVLGIDAPIKVEIDDAARRQLILEEVERIAQAMGWDDAQKLEAVQEAEKVLREAAVNRRWTVAGGKT